MATKKLKVKWFIQVEEVYEATVEIDQDAVDTYEYDLQSYLLLEVLPGMETTENQVSNINVSEREIDRILVESADD